MVRRGNHICISWAASMGLVFFGVVFVEHTTAQHVLYSGTVSVLSCVCICGSWEVVIPVFG